jgi:uncharacterized RDD family membrane protein YckC
MLIFKKRLRKDFFYRAIKFRLTAKFIDLLLVFLGVIFFYPMGIIIGVIYLSLADSLYQGQSIGKRFMGLGVVSLVDGSPCSIFQSCVRNLPITAPLFFLIFPLWWGWVISAIFAFPMTLMEIYFIFKGSHHRLGDIMADTTVIANDGSRLDLRKTKHSWFDTPPVPMQ